ncbi:hypothetical protein MMC11_002711 [Xylographa trunciseda]|nr:hypothetical protein [Xylographa trunciseda]
MTTEPPNGYQYGLSRAFKASVRLNCQHLLWKANTGYLLHPEIPVTDGLRIADIGTGTGMWPIEVSKTLPPSAQLDGFDISGDQFPPAEWLPSNVTLSTADAFAPIPEDMVGKYDVVHLRMMVIVVKGPKELETLMNNLVLLLKPGGYLQWSDCDPASIAAIPSRPDMPHPAGSRLLEYMLGMNAARGMDWRSFLCLFFQCVTHPEPFEFSSWVSILPAIFSRASLTVLTSARLPIAPELRASWTDNQLMVFEEYYVMMGAASGSEVGIGYWKLLAEAVQETRTGVGLCMEMVVCVGRKGL